MRKEDIIRIEDEYLVRTYQKLGIVISKGKGSRVWDIDGKEYLDFMGGYGVAIVGHSHPRIIEAIRRQASKLIICHGSLYNDERASFIEELLKVSPKSLEMAYLSNSGAEAVEAALKMVRKFTGKRKFIAAVGAYHGKTMGALSVTYSNKYRAPFAPFPYEVEFVRFGSIEDIEKCNFSNVAGIILEPIQGEGGVKVPPPDYLKAVRELADKKGVPLIIDEIQTGLARTGKMWAHQHWNIEPDVMTIGKGIASGIPMGVTLAKKEIASSLKVGEHTSTFGGNPLSSSVAKAVLEIITKEKLEERARLMGQKLIDGLKDIACSSRIVREVRGLGLMIGIELRVRFQDILFESIKKGLLMLYSGKNILRLLPPLIINEKDVREALEILKYSIINEDKRRHIEQ